MPPDVEFDKRLRSLVYLSPTDTGITKYYCPVCRSFVQELVNAFPAVTSDIVELEGTIGTGARCSGRKPDGTKCHIWYYFVTRTS